MAVAVRSPDGVTSGTISAATATWTLTKPTGTAQNDVLLAVFTTGTTSLVSTPPTGWSQVWSQDQGTEQTQHVYRKVAGASEPATYDFGLNGSEIGPWAIVAVTGADTTTPINASLSGTTSAGTSHTTPSITPTVNGCLLVATYSNNAASTTVTYTAPTGMTEQFDLAEGTSFIALSGHTEVQATAAAVSKTATSSGSDSTACGLLAVAPAAGGGTTPVGQSFAVPYQVIATVGRSFAVPYAVIETIGRSTVVAYAIQGAAAAKALTNQIVGGRMTKHGALPPFREPAGGETQGSIGRSFSLPYMLSGGVGRSFAVPYGIGGGVSRSFAVPYSIQTTNVRYLSPTGSNANNGLTSSTPWQTMQYAVQNAPNPCTVYLLAGTYPSFTWSNYTGRTAYATFTPAAGASVTCNGFSPASTAVNWVAFDGVFFDSTTSLRGNNWQFRNCDWQHAAASASALVFEDGSSELTCEDCTFTGSNIRFAIFWASGAGQALITNSYVRRNVIDGTRHGGFNCRGFENCVVEDNIIRNVTKVTGDETHRDSIRTAYGGNGWYVRRNLIHDNNALGIFMKDGTAVTNAEITDNIVIRNTGTGIQEFQFYNVEGLTLVNNTTDGKIGFGAATVTSTANDVIMFNNICNQLIKYGTVNELFRNYNLVGSYVGFSQAANDVVGAATYVNAAGNDLRLTAASLGVDDGAATGGGFAAPATDHDGRARPSVAGGAVDIGAFERQAGDP